MRELEQGHPEEIKVAVHPDGQPVMTVVGVVLVGGLPSYMPSPVITNPPPPPKFLR